MARPRTESAPKAASEPEQPEPNDETFLESLQTDTVEILTVIEALSAVMGDVQYVSKTGRNTSQNFNFRGIDAVLNAVGPALRAHGVVVLPVAVKSEVEQYQTKNNTTMKNVTLDVTFRFYGPAGDHIEGTARGEAADAGDKATAKAHSVALRTILLQALCIPTDEPDPDQDSHERVHESGFQGGARDDPAPKRVETPAYNWPKDPKELAARMGAHVGDEESVEWISQAVKVATGNHELRYSELPEPDQRVAWAVLTKVLREIEDEGDLVIHPTPRETISGIFAKYLDGQVLNGPTWALTGEEAEAGYPAKEVVASEEGKVGDAADDAERRAEAEREEEGEPEAMSLAEQIAAEEAAEAAARDNT